MGAIKRGALCLGDLLDRLRTVRAGLLRTTIDIEGLLEISRFAILPGKITQGCATLCNGTLQYVLDGVNQALVTWQ
jgi:hypothetical protein